MAIEMENVVMELIINAGEARSQAMMAIQAARQRNWELAKAALSAAQESIRAAHLIQTQLIGEDEGQGKIPVNLILVHAQDHLMTAMLCRDLAEEIVLLRQEYANASTV